MRWPWGTIALLTACGRVGFGPAGGDAPSDPDADVPFVEARGALDPGFGVNGIIEVRDPTMGVSTYAVVDRPNGYYAVGVHGDGSGIARMGLFAIDDAGVAGNVIDIGPSVDSDYAYGATRVGDDRIAIVGDGDIGNGSNDDITIALVDDAGGLQTAFGSDGYARVDVSNLQRADTGHDIVHADGKLFACGTASYATANSHLVIVKLDAATGALDPAWGTSGQLVDDFSANIDDDCNAVVVRPDGGVYIVGTAGGELVVAAYTATGARDTTFAGSGRVLLGTNAIAYGVAIVGTDVVAVGEDNGESIIVKLSASGAPIPSFGINGVAHLPLVADMFSGIVAQPNGKLVMSGFRGTTGVVARVDENGALDPAFGTGGWVDLPHSGKVELTRVVVEPGGRILTTGRVGVTEPYYGVVARFE